MSKELDKFIGKSVYVLSNAPDSRKVKGIFVTTSVDSLINKLNNIQIDTAEYIVVARGILASAQSIPNNIEDKSVKPFVIIERISEAENFSCLVELNNCEELEVVITDLTRDYPPDADTLEKIDDEILDALFDTDQQKIEDLYVLYGYRLPLTYNLIELEDGDKIISKSIELFNTIKEYN